MKLNLTHITAALACLFLIACQQNEPNITTSFDSKHEPYDLASLQRAYPNQTFDTRAYKKAFEEAIAKNQDRSTTPSGFDADWITQGPGDAGARINVIEIDPANDDIVYLGYSGGGVWKTTDNGLTWNPIFDESPFLAIGSIEIDPTDSDIVYVGTGDPNITGYPYIGNGVYKSTNAGATWTEMGLQNAGTISKIQVDPTNHQIVYASSMGSPFVQNNDRGLYKSFDGGNSWTQVLNISTHTGIIDFVLDPVNTNRIYACGWDRIRNATNSYAAGGGGRIFRSTNGGSNWTLMTNGLPTNTALSRSSLAMSATNPNTIYASIIDSTFRLKGVYKTTNGGDSWTTVTDGETNGLNNPVSSFGWYFGRVFVNPSNDNQIYLCGVRAWYSATGGAGWNLAAPSGTGNPHVDNHYMAFNSVGDTYLATDGGLYRRDNGGTIWEDIEDIPTTQFYRVAYNPHEINTYYGGAQDNGTQAGNASNITNWDRLFGADGFELAFDPIDDDRFFLETQNGDIWMTSDSSGFQAATIGINNSDRLHWDMQYIISSHNRFLMYTGTYRMYKSDIAGNPLWQPISNDLTNGTTPGQIEPTISTVADAPMDSLTVYCGTTDANVWRSLDAGTTWTNISNGLPERYVTCVKGSPDMLNGVYVSHSGYLSGENSSHIHYSTDNGNTWTDISGDLPDLAINHIEIMPNNNGNVIFVATDGGVYATLNAGQNWHRLGGNLPYIVTYDLAINLAKNELVAGTFGRSIQSFPLDSIGVSLTPPAVVDISGQITTPSGANMNNVDLVLDTGPTQNTQSDASGLYAFEDITVGNTSTVTPSKNVDADNGVTTFDVLLIKKHILFIDTLDSPYKLIAADVNKSGSISGFDILLLSKIILTIDTVFTSNESWRFIQSDYDFPDPMNPFVPTFPETYEYNPLTSNQLAANFIGIKIGDVTGNADPSGFAVANDRSFVGELPLNIQDQTFKKGERVVVSFQSKDFHDMLGYQFTIGFDHDLLAFESIDKSSLANIGSQGFGETQAEQGLITTNWSHTSTTNLSEKDTLFVINFVAKADGKLSELLRLEPGYVSKEAYQYESDFLDISLRFENSFNSESNEKVIEVERFQNTPNPFVTSTIVEFYFPNSESATLELLTHDGKLIQRTQKDFPKGRTKIELSENLFPTTGVYLYRLSTQKEQKTIRLIRI